MKKYGVPGGELTHVTYKDLSEKDINVPKILEYHGFIKVKIHCPDNIYAPILQTVYEGENICPTGMIEG